jgi:hypothetical protein
MSDWIERSQTEAEHFDDELSDEALDRPADIAGACRWCSGPCASEDRPAASSSSCFTAGRPCHTCFAE